MSSNVQSLQADSQLQPAYHELAQSEGREVRRYLTPRFLGAFKSLRTLRLCTQTMILVCGTLPLDTDLFSAIKSGMFIACSHVITELMHSSIVELTYQSSTGTVK
jgi:hypothetical protein